MATWNSATANFLPHTSTMSVTKFVQKLSKVEDTVLNGGTAITPSGSLLVVEKGLTDDLIQMRKQAARNAEVWKQTHDKLDYTVKGIESGDVDFQRGIMNYFEPKKSKRKVEDGVEYVPGFKLNAAGRTLMKSQVPSFLKHLESKPAEDDDEGSGGEDDTIVEQEAKRLAKKNKPVNNLRSKTYLALMNKFRDVDEDEAPVTEASV